MARAESSADGSDTGYRRVGMRPDPLLAPTNQLSPRVVLRRRGCENYPKERGKKRLDIRDAATLVIQIKTTRGNRQEQTQTAGSIRTR